ncbi:DUF2164 domain-containing protein [Filobacillus milosensis]|uniref:DUF2164 domain-containing protein n=1 Tax=Filobacillus milosensis TaxID=94137 RepID=A0A4Y8IKA2_9BACI|nr:DUF2164 domain-containing protein [Filobacillus milosensis]TFB21374.1 DUF2164 domain-containing protein [Filobacillus milosensis]
MINLKKEQKQHLIEQIKEYFYNERSEEIGDLAAENFFHFMAEEVGPHFYNKGLHDAKDVFEQKVMNMDEDIRALERNTK